MKSITKNEPKEVVSSIDLTNIQSENAKEQNSTRNRNPLSFYVGKKPFRCERCESSYSQKGSLKRHVAAVHDGMKPFRCELCDYSCSRKDHLKILTESTQKESHLIVNFVVTALPQNKN